MQQYNYLQAIYSSFYSGRLYRDVHQNWGAGVIIYLLLLLALCWAVEMVPIQSAITAHFDQIAKEFVPQAPTVTITNGIVSTPENRPYIIIDHKTNERIAVIDTSGQYNTIAAANSKVLLTKNSLLIKNDEGPDSFRTEVLPQKLNVTLAPTAVRDFFEGFVMWAWAFIYPVVLFFSLVYRLVQSFIYAILGKIIAAITGVPLPFSNMIKLSIVALTPVIIITTVLDLFMVTFHFQLLFYFLLTLAYLIFAIKANQVKGPA